MSRRAIFHAAISIDDDLQPTDVEALENEYSGFQQHSLHKTMASQRRGLHQMRSKRKRQWQRRLKRCRGRLCRHRVRGETTRHYVYSILESSNFGRAIEVSQVVLSTVMVILGIVASWDTAATEEHGVEWMNVVELICTIFFTIDYAVRLYAAESRIRFVFSFLAMIDILTITPSWVTWGSTQSDNTLMQYMRGLRAVRVFRAYRILSLFKSAISRQAMTVAVTVISVLLSTAGLVQTLESIGEQNGGAGQDLSFLDSVYFVVVTVTTVGFGDVAPKNTLTRSAVALVILATMVLIPTQISKLSALVAQRGLYDGTFTPSATGQGHVVVCGDVSVHKLGLFLQEFFVAATEHAVVLSTKAPSHDMLRLVQGSDHDGRVSFVRGSALSHEDLWRVKAHLAHACFILPADSCTSVEEADIAASFIATSMSLYIRRQTRKQIPIFTEVVTAQAIRHALLGGANHAVSSQRIAMAIMAASVPTPVISAFVTNLVASMDMPHSRSGWLAEYARGAANQVYAVAVPASLTGVSFQDATEIAFAEVGAIPIALQRGVDTTKLGSGSTTHSRFASGFATGVGIPDSITNARRRNSNVVLPGAEFPSDPKPAEDAETSIAIAPFASILGYKDRLIVIAPSQIVADEILAITAARVEGYTDLQMVSRSTGPASRSPNTASLIKHDERDVHGWAIAKKHLTIGPLGQLRGFIRALPLDKRVSILRAFVDKANDPMFVLAMRGGNTPSSRAGKPGSSIGCSSSGAGSGINGSTRPSLRAMEEVSMKDLQPSDSASGSSAPGRPQPNPHAMMGTSSTTAFSAAQMSAAHRQVQMASAQLPSLRESGSAGAGAGAGSAGGGGGSVGVHRPGKRPAFLPHSVSAPVSAMGAVFAVDETKSSESPLLPGMRTPQSSAGASGHHGHLSSFPSAHSWQAAQGSVASHPHLRSASSVATFNSQALLATPHEASMGHMYASAAPLGPPQGDLQNHVVICGTPARMGTFMAQLRLRVKEAVVIISPSWPSASMQSQASKFDQVYFVHGSSRERSCLIQASAYTAASIIIMANPTSAGSKTQHIGVNATSVLTEEVRKDADAITTLRCILEFADSAPKPPNVVIELQHGDNVKFVNYLGRSEQTSMFATTSAAFLVNTSRGTGRSSMELEGATPGPNGHVDDKLASVSRYHSGSEYVYYASFAAGLVCTTHLTTSLLGAAYQKPYLIELVDRLLGSTMPATNSKHAGGVPHLQVHDINAKFIGAPFVRLFVHMARFQKQVCVGLLRHGSGLHSALPYLYTNPPFGVRIDPGDMVLTLTGT